MRLAPPQPPPEACWLCAERICNPNPRRVSQKLICIRLAAAISGAVGAACQTWPFGVGSRLRFAASWNGTTCDAYAKRGANLIQDAPRQANQKQTQAINLADKKLVVSKRDCLSSFRKPSKGATNKTTFERAAAICRAVFCATMRIEGTCFGWSKATSCVDTCSESANCQPALFLK